jgi:hypothetical protein
MRKLAPSEKTLFLILCGAVFLALNLLSFKIFLAKRQQVQLEITKTKTTLAEGRGIIQLAQVLEPANSWIHQHPLPIWTPDQASSELLKSERDQAEKNSLKIIDENLLPAHPSKNADSVSVQIKITGPFEGVMKFLFALQNPTAWRTIERFIIKSDAEPSKVIIEFELKQFFKLPGASTKIAK